MRIGVYGLGRFGRLWAELLAERHQVYAFDVQGANFPPGVLEVSEEQLLDCDALFLTVAISAIEAVACRLAPLLERRGSGPMVLDCCSVKHRPLQTLLARLPPWVTVIGTHPMFGPDSVRAGLRGLTLVLCPGRQNEDQLRSWRWEFEQMGLTVLQMGADQHDQEAAETQGLTHLLGRALKQMGLRPSAMATTGYKVLCDVVTHTGNDSWQLFCDLQRYNPYSGAMRRRLQESLSEVYHLLDGDKREYD